MTSCILRIWNCYDITIKHHRKFLQFEVESKATKKTVVRCTLIFESDRFAYQALQTEWWNHLKFLHHYNKNEAIP